MRSSYVIGGVVAVIGLIVIAVVVVVLLNTGDDSESDNGNTAVLPTAEVAVESAVDGGEQAANTVPTRAPAFRPTDTPAPPTLAFEECDWQFATEEMPDLASQVRTMVADLPELFGVTLSVEAIAQGEHCLRLDSTVDHFTATQTDFTITATTNSTVSTAVMLSAILQTLVAEFPTDQTPGAMDGMVRIEIFTGDEDPPTLIGFVQVTYDVLNGLLDDGLTGEALVNALGGVAQ